jgi:hypothetical protein
MATAISAALGPQRIKQKLLLNRKGRQNRKETLKSFALFAPLAVPSVSRFLAYPPDFLWLRAGLTTIESGETAA